MTRLADRRGFLRQASGAGLVGIGELLTMGVAHGGEPIDGGVLRAGTARIDITPQKFPVLVCGGFLSRTADSVTDPVYARCLVLDDGTEKVVLMVVDVVGFRSPLVEAVKEAASKSTGIPHDRMMISATHTHSGGSVLSGLGTKVDPEYIKFLPSRLVECIEKAAGNLRPARIGWSSEDHPEGTHCRRFIRRPDCIGVDPTGRRTVRAMMHPGYQNPEFIGPCGPTDPEVSVLAVQTLEGKPMALVANYSMHYFGSRPISADYFGDFARIVSDTLAAGDESFVAMMSQGTSGDQQWQDYANPHKSISRSEYAARVADAALRAYKRIEFHDSVPIAMAERRLTVKLQQPDKEIVAWREKVYAEMDGRDPRTQSEVYAREIILLKKLHDVEAKLQAIRIGDLGIAAMPAEAYACTGLKLKLQCPLSAMFNVTLANGCIGYIPPPELRPMGGYNTWPARHTSTQTDVETIVVDSLLEMFEELASRPRRKIVLSQGSHAKRILAEKPLAYWRLGEIEGTQAVDASGNGNHGSYQTGYVFYVDGPNRDNLRAGDQKPRAVQFVGGRMKAQFRPGADYEVELFFWNGLPNDNRPVTGYLFSLGPDGDASCPGDHLGIAGTAAASDVAGRLFVFNGNEKDETIVGGRCDNFANLEGRMAEVAIY